MRTQARSHTSTRVKTQRDEHCACHARHAKPAHSANRAPEAICDKDEHSILLRPEQQKCKTPRRSPRRGSASALRQRPNRLCDKQVEPNAERRCDCKPRQHFQRPFSLILIRVIVAPGTTASAQADAVRARPSGAVAQPLSRQAASRLSDHLSRPWRAELPRGWRSQTTEPAAMTAPSPILISPSALHGPQSRSP